MNLELLVLMDVIIKLVRNMLLGMVDLEVLVERDLQSFSMTVEK